MEAFRTYLAAIQASLAGAGPRQLLLMPSGHMVGEGCCAFGAWHGLLSVYKDRSLRIVSGSLGWGKDEPFWHFGGPDFTTLEQFKHTWLGGGAMDVHVWLEDASGCVYDIVMPS